jgi:O-antigen ligase
MKLLSSIPRWAIYALIIFTPLPLASVDGWAITIIHLLTLTALTAFLLEKSLTSNWTWIRTPLDVPILLLILLSILSTVFSIHRPTSFWAVVLLINYVLIFYLVVYTIQTRSQVRQLVYLIIGMATFLSIFGIFKRFGVNPFPWWDYGSLHGGRLTATFYNPDHLAGYMEMALPLLLGLFLTGMARGKHLLMAYVAFMLLCALVLSLSRGGWFGLLAGLFFMAMCLLFDPQFTHKGLILALMGGTVAIVLIVLASTPVVERILTMTEGGIEPSMHDRVVIWGATSSMIAEHPLTGTGPGTYAVAFTGYQPPGLTSQYRMAHNDYLHFISETGIGLIPIAAWMTFSVYARAFKKLRNPSRLVRGITLGAVSGITAILVHSIVDFNLHIPANAILFTLLAGLIASPVPVHDRFLRR